MLEYRRIYPLLTAQKETWALDLLGFDFTERLVNLSYNPRTIKDHFYCFWRKMINRPMVLVASSMGGATAIDFATTYPDRVQSKVVAATERRSLDWDYYILGLLIKVGSISTKKRQCIKRG